MVAVGLWGAFLGRPAIWLLPVVFTVVMAFCGALGVPLPHVETGTAFGLCARPCGRAGGQAPLWLAAVLVGVFAIFYGHAHGTELRVAANSFAYAVGFVVGTGCLHILGIAFGLLTRSRTSPGAASL